MDMEKFDQAADEAFQEWKIIESKFTPAEKAVVATILAWWRKWYSTAGHKRLAGIFLGRRG